MNNSHCVIIGSGHAAAQHAPSLRQNGWEGKITIISNEKSLPYQRPTLSKSYLSDNSDIHDILIRSEDFYARLNISFLFGVNVTAINRGTKTLVLDAAAPIKYSKLAITTGAYPRKIDIPGSNLAGVYYLRNLTDVDKIRQMATAGKKVIIIGGGYMGLEIAATLRQTGMKVSILETAPRLLQRVTSQEISAFYTRIHQEQGVDIFTDRSVTAIAGKTLVEKVYCTNGLTLPADLVIVAIGVIPNMELAERAGLKTDNGIFVNEHAQTSDPDIVAAGDCTYHYNPVYSKMIRLESVQNAVDQAKIAARTICGRPHAYHSLPWFWSDQYDLKLQIAGLSQGYDQIVIRGTIGQGRGFSAFYFKGGKFIAVDAVNKPKEFMLSKRLLLNGQNPDPQKLENTKINILDIVKSATK